MGDGKGRQNVYERKVVGKRLLGRQRTGGRSLLK
jgi:hypothetical protein